MDPEQRKKRIILIVIGCIVVAAIAIAVAWWLWPRASTHTSSSATSQSSAIPAGGITSLSFSQDIYQTALQRAQSWQSDAALMTMTSGDATGQVWNFVFVSQKADGQAFQIAMNGQTVVSAEQISLAGSGAALPQNIISPDQALAAGHAVPGYASSWIQSVKLTYSAAAKQWYWGLRTSSGFTIAIKAAP